MRITTAWATRVTRSSARCDAGLVAEPDAGVVEPEDAGTVEPGGDAGVDVDAGVLEPIGAGPVDLPAVDPEPVNATPRGCSAAPGALTTLLSLLALRRRALKRH